MFAILSKYICSLLNLCFEMNIWALQNDRLTTTVVNCLLDFWNEYK